MHIDNPINRKEDDQFGFSRYCDALVQVVRSSYTPLTIGIFGPWGSGKTSLLKLIREDLSRQSGQDHWRPLTVWFDAWQYDRDEALWRALILTVLGSLREGASGDLLDELDRVEASLYRTVEWQELGKWTIDWAQALEGTVRGATQVALAFVPGAAPLARTIERVWNELRGERATAEQIEQAAQAISREVQKYRREQMRSLEQFQRDFSELVRRNVLERNRRLVVFIDDLDRCLPEKAIEVLETLKLFLSAEGCFFFLAADRDVIEKGIRVKYQSFLVGAGETLQAEGGGRRIPITGRDYIEKIVQLPFSLPPLEPNRVEDFVKRLYPDLEECAEVCATGLEPNPRKVKRTLNLLRLVGSLSQDITDKGLLAKVVVIQSRYPELYAQLLDYPLLLQELERYFRKSGEIPPPAAVDPLEGTLYELRDQFIRHKALGDMLRLEPHFTGLSRDQIRRYLYLTRATSEDKRVIEAEAPETSLWEDLRSGDLTQITDAVDRIRAAGQDEKHAEQIGSMLERADLGPRERLSLGLAWGQLGYPKDLDTRVRVPGSECELGKYPVTNQQFRRFIDAGGYEKQSLWDDERRYAPAAKQPRDWENPRWSQPTQPVVGVSWYEARAYCRWLSEETGQVCRLPTEEEWIRTATNREEVEPATETPSFPWGDSFDPSYANTSESRLGVTTPVGCYPLGASLAGALDMSGNVWEWTADDGYQMGSKAMRGGSWHDGSDKAHWAAREDALPTFRAEFVGFRVLFEQGDRL